MDRLRRIIEIAKEKPWKCRIKLINQELSEEWSEWIITPTEGYVELKSIGPMRITDIDWIEINPIEIRRVGKLIPSNTFDHFDEVTSLLSDLSIHFTVKEKIIRIKILD